MPARYHSAGDEDNIILRKILENQTQVIAGTLTLKVTGGGGGGGGTATRQAATNNSGNTTLTAIAAIVIEHTAVVTVGGTARTSEIALPITNRTAGDKAAVKFIFPVTDLIVVNLRNSTTAGTILKTLTTDTSGDDATIFVVYDGATWELLGYLYPI